MADTYNGRKRIRKQFGSIPEVAEMPNLIEVQKSSYDDFLMVKEPPGGARRSGPAGGIQVGVPDLGFLRAGPRSTSSATSSSRPSTTSTSASSAT